MTNHGSLRLHVQIEDWPLVAPFRITGYTWTSLQVLIVTLEQEGHIGRGEAAGVYYKGDLPPVMLRSIESIRATIEAGVDRTALQTLLPPGGARNALDCALWDLEAKTTGRSAWQIAGLQEPRPLLTTFTCSAGTPKEMACAACAFTTARALKLKLTGEPADADRVLAVRAARPDVWLGIDANQGLTRGTLERLMPVLVQARVALIEQPFPVGQEGLLDGLQSPIPIAADESVQSVADIATLRGRCSVINIKLDKCGGLTEGLAMARAAGDLGMDPMVGNMLGTSLAMSPAFLVGQLCGVVDLDGPIFLKTDRPDAVQYTDGFISCPETIWGSGP
jgi:L-Ala-D/L-Glu epimerase